jgi:hypothetical protein
LDRSEGSTAFGRIDPPRLLKPQELEMAFTINLSKIKNPLDIEFSIDGQLYVAVDTDGEIITFKSNCATCGEEFTCWGILKKFGCSANRRCAKHRQPGVRVKPRNKRVAAVAKDHTAPLDAVITELRKKRAAGKTMKQLVKWMWETQGVHCTGAEIWKLVRTVKPATNVINLKPRS